MTTTRIWLHMLVMAWSGLGVIFTAAGLAVPGENQRSDQRQPRPAKFVQPYLIEVHGDLNWRKSKFVRARIEQARSLGADLIVLEINSDRGLQSESLNLGELIRDIDWAYTVALVSDQATGSTALIPWGCDEWFVGQQSRIGNVGPIVNDAPLFALRMARDIQAVDLIQQARDLATSKGRSGELIRAMIDKNYAVYLKTDRERPQFRGQDSDQVLDASWALIPETQSGFMLLTGERALALGIAQGVTQDRNARTALTQSLGISLSEMRIVRPTATDAIVYYLNHPLGMSLLVLIGMIALFVELSAPGIGAGGLIAGLSATLFFWSRMLGGTSTWLEILLFFAGLIFLMMELLVIPGWGLPGIMGILLMVSSIFLASQEFVLPGNARQWNQFLTSALMLLCTGMLFALAAGFIVRNFGYLPIFGKLMLAPPPELSTDSPTKLGSNLHPLVSVGDWGRADSLLRPAGRAIFAGRSIDVVSDGEYIPAGTQVKVLSIHGNRIVVTAISEV